MHYGHPARLSLFSRHLVAELQKESGYPQVGQEMSGDAGGGEGGFSVAECQIGNELVSQMRVYGRAAREVLQELLRRLGADRLCRLAAGAEGGKSGPDTVRIRPQEQESPLSRTRRVEKSDIRSTAWITKTISKSSQG